MSKQNVVEKSVEVISPKRHLYVIYDFKSEDVESISYLFPDEALVYFQMLANDVTTKLYFKLEDIVIFDLGEFDPMKIAVKERIDLIDYVDQRRRDLQTIIQTLNYLPNGYFKMPVEIQKTVQEKINLACNDYVNKFLSKEDIEKAFVKGVSNDN